MKSELNRIVNQFALGGRDLVLTSTIIAMETERGFVRVPVGSVEWLSPWIWHRNSVVTRDDDRVRLVLLEALRQREGAFTKLVADIQACGLIPVVVEPHDRLARKLEHWRWRHRRIGVGFTGENIWYPRHE